MQLSRSGPEGAGRRPKGRSGVLGLTLVIFGLLLLGAVGLYYGYGIHARSRLDNLNYSVEANLVPSPEAQTQQFVPKDNTPLPQVARSDTPPSTITPPEKRPQPLKSVSVAPTASPPVQQATVQDSPVETEDVAYPVASYTSIYPGTQMHPKYWSHPLWAGTDVRQDSGLPEGFRSFSTAGVSASLAATGNAQRIRIPIINVDSGVGELEILDLGDSRAYETPKGIVGHLPKTSNPGEAGNGWFFGHLESPIRGEGNVFSKLPDIPDHLRNYVETGENPVYVNFESEDVEYLYQVIATQVVHQDDLWLFETDDAAITLVTCVPRLYYDHRLLVTAKLVGIKD